MLAALTSHYERAMVTFLDHSPFWKGATLFYHADNLPHWRKRKSLPQQAAAVTPAASQALAASIRTFFHHTEGLHLKSKPAVTLAYRPLGL